MEDPAKLKFKKCSLGMKHRIGTAMAMPDDPALLILDGPINGLDPDGMRIMREIFADITTDLGCTVPISSPSSASWRSGAALLILQNQLDADGAAHLSGHDGALPPVCGAAGRERPVFGES